MSASPYNQKGVGAEGQPPAPEGQQPAPLHQPPAPEGQPITAGERVSAPEGQPVAPPPPSGSPFSADAPAPVSTPMPPIAAPSGSPLAPPVASTQGEPQPTRYRVHHSYIWLGGLGTIATLTAVIFFSAFAGIMGEGVQAIQGEAQGTFLLIALGLIILILVLAGIIIAVQVLSFKNLSYEIGPEEFSVYSGIITKRHVHVPYQRIQSVNQRASLLQRIAGVCTVSIDTAGGSSNKAVVVPYVQKAEAERLRTELFARKRMILEGQATGLSAAQMAHAGQAAQAAQAAYTEPQPPAPQGQQAFAGIPAPLPTAGQPAAAPMNPHTNVLDTPADILTNTRGLFGGDYFDTGEVSYEYGMSNKELILTGLTNNTGFAVMVLALVGGAVSVVSQVLQTGIGQNLVNQGVNWALGAFAGNFVLVIVLAVLLFLAVFWLFSILGTCLTYGGFKARRRTTRIEVERGLLQHQFDGVDIDRVQSVVIKQGFIRRFFGYCELSLGKIDALSGGEASEGQKAASTTQGLVIHPFVKLTRVPEILNGLVPEFADVPTEHIKLPKVSLRRGLIRRCILNGAGVWLAIMVALAQIILNTVIVPHDLLETALTTTALYAINTIAIILYVLCAVILIFEVIGTVLWFRHSSFAYNAVFMQITNGGFSQTSISFPRRKIQFGFIKTNPFQRRAQVATIAARTAAGIGGTTMKLLDVSTENADSWLAWLIPGGNK